ncbi:MAG: hypothetical protein LBG06_00305 [Deltaproteobacteria bacterium]|nr:hypothetical protein [Deltaproteobacteria bacterium]
MKAVPGDSPCGAGRYRAPGGGIGAGIVASRHGGLKVPPGSGAEAGDPGFTPAGGKTVGREPLTGAPAGWRPGRR